MLHVNVEFLTAFDDRTWATEIIPVPLRLRHSPERMIRYAEDKLATLPNAPAYAMIGIYSIDDTPVDESGTPAGDVVGEYPVRRMTLTFAADEAYADVLGGMSVEEMVHQSMYGDLSMGAEADNLFLLDRTQAAELLTEQGSDPEFLIREEE